VGKGSVISSVGRGSAPTHVADARGTEVGSSARGRFEGVEATRPSQRYDRFEVGVAAGVDLASTTRSRLEGPGDLLFVVWPATFAAIETHKPSHSSQFTFTPSISGP
jgi:hypothetical protein